MTDKTEEAINNGQSNIIDNIRHPANRTKTQNTKMQHITQS